ncbi:hypothetical protein OJ996_09335 [Luteolibacter sp. GHJ8]|uniref:Tetratricopeptide repeat protein n=1 Tax=Luteolibacter rhizosphaerae TaxID=2989719 RepID=A0ABT3G1S2_9BACT|nr:hypothetical protein [Luteolibacter rhizosphaerae]MCW1913777.1 hypothetical protein [Luteolibacter rhizosphaerae]
MQVTPPQDQNDKGNFQQVIMDFAESVESILVSIDPVLTAMKREAEEYFAPINQMMERLVPVMPENPGETSSFALHPEDKPNFSRHHRLYIRRLKARSLMQRSLLISIISQYDAFIASLLRETYIAHPTRIDQSGKTFTLSDIEKMGGLTAVRERIIEDDIDDFLRKSHYEQIEKLKTAYRLPADLLKEELPGFVEAAQRRHLFVHNDGRVGRRYITNCQEAGYKLADGIEIGSALDAGSEYLIGIAELVYAVGLKIGFGVWLQIYKGDKDLAGQSANSLAFDLISNDRHSLAARLIEYALIKPNVFLERLERCLVINLAQAYKWMGENEKALAVINRKDWSAMPDDLRIGELLIRDDFDTACILVRRLKAATDFEAVNYQQWPIFRDLIKQPLFLETFREVYGQEFIESVVPEAVLRDDITQGVHADIAPHEETK